MKRKISWLLTLVLMLSTIFCVEVFAAEWKTGNIVGYNQSCGYTNVYLIANKTAKIKVYAYNAAGKEVATSGALKITVTDSAGKEIKTYDGKKSGDSIQLNNANTSYAYRIYIRKTYTETYRPETKYNKNRIIKFWAIKTTSNATFNYDKSYSKKMWDEMTKNSQKQTNNNTNSNETTNSTNTSTKLYENMTYYIIPKHAQNSVLDTYGGNSSKSEGSNIVIWNYNGGDYGSRMFKFVSVGSGWYKIVNENNGLVLDVNCSNKNVALYKYHGAANQLWKLENAGDGYYYIRTKVTDRNKTAYYLDVHGARTSNGTNVEVCDLNGGNNQKFKLMVAVKGAQS